MQGLYVCTELLVSPRISWASSPSSGKCSWPLACFNFPLTSFSLRQSLTELKPSGWVRLLGPGILLLHLSYQDHRALRPLHMGGRKPRAGPQTGTASTFTTNLSLQPQLTTFKWLTVCRTYDLLRQSASAFSGGQMWTWVGEKVETIWEAQGREP